MVTKTELKKAWTGKKAPLVERRFTATVMADGPKAIPLQEMANRHRELGYHVTTESVDKEGIPYLRVTIEHGDVVAERAKGCVLVKAAKKLVGKACHA